MRDRKDTPGGSRVRTEAEPGALGAGGGRKEPPLGPLGVLGVPRRRRSLDVPVRTLALGFAEQRRSATAANSCGRRLLTAQSR